MATIAATNMQGTGQRAVALTTLTGTADTFTYKESTNPVLIMRNSTAGALSPNIKGASATTVPVSGVSQALDISSGYAVGSIAAGAAVAIPLYTIREYLKGAIAITGGTGLVCSLLEF